MSPYLSLPIIPHLLDLLYATRDDGIKLTLAGGLGLYLKRADIVRRIESEGLPTLLPRFPEARATSDMDLFVHLELFADLGKEARLRTVLCDVLKYKPRTNYWQFEKSVPASSGIETTVKIDLMAREPGPHEPLAQVHDTRVKTTLKRPTSDAIHGRRTPEAFAIDTRPYTIQVEGQRSTGEPHRAEALLPHPFASLMMKLQAALDHARMRPEARHPQGHRHAFDVYLLLAMMTESEWHESCQFARETYAREPVFVGLKSAAPALFETDSAPGCLDIRTAHGGGSTELELPRLRELLTELLA